MVLMAIHGIDFIGNIFMSFNFWHMDTTADSDKLQSGSPIFNYSFEQMELYIGNKEANVGVQAIQIC